MPREPSTNVGLIAMSLGGAAAAGGSTVLRLSSIPGDVLGLPLSCVVGAGLCAAGSIAALGGLMLAVVGPGRPSLAAIMLGTIGVDGLVLLGALSSNPAMIRTPLAVFSPPSVGAHPPGLGPACPVPTGRVQMRPLICLSFGIGWTPAASDRVLPA